MSSPESKFLCQKSDRMSDSSRENQRLKALADLGLLDSESIPVFEEATQTAAHFLNAPICVLGLLNAKVEWFKSAVGLSRIGLMNGLATSRQLLREDSFCARIVETPQVLMLNDTVAQPAFADSLLVKKYGIRAYLGAPLFTAQGDCLGTLAIMDLAPREFTVRDAELLEVIARWSMSEFERNFLLKKAPQFPQSPFVSPQVSPDSTDAARVTASSVKANLLTQMTEELRTPLTSILGMASVLNREIFGPLTDKQKEYLGIVHSSGQHLLALVNEILDLGTLEDIKEDLNPSSVDIEMLCQQALSSLGQAARRQGMQIRLTVEPGSRLWSLDREKVRQILYHLVFGVMQSSPTDSIIRVHVSKKLDHLNVAIWTSHPWLGEGLPQAEIHLMAAGKTNGTEGKNGDRSLYLLPNETTEESIKPSPIPPAQTKPATHFPKLNSTRQHLGITLCRQLISLHGGTLALQGSAEAGYRYVISLPQLLPQTNGRDKGLPT
jgi:signal transduction histidine kinase